MKYIVTGNPRSGTSMTMNILDEGGITAIQDNRTNAGLNPNGSFETLVGNVDFSTIDGKSIKVLGAQQIFNLPEGEYKVILPIRDPEQILLSRAEAFKMKSLPTNYAKQIDMIARQTAFVKFVVNHRPDMELLKIPYEDYFLKPTEVVDKIATFVGVPFNKAKGVACIDTESYKVRTKEEVAAKIAERNARLAEVIPAPVDNVVEENVL